MHPPSVDSLARSLAKRPELARLGHASLVGCARRAVRENPTDAESEALRHAGRLVQSLLTPVINATGVLLHTNLGRAPLLPTGQAASTADPSSPWTEETSPRTATTLPWTDRSSPWTNTAPPEIDSLIVRYSNLEFDLAGGVRGSRRSLTEELLRTLTGAEAALVVNNCAAAVMLALGANAVGRGVAVSRGELVEIGGGFRIPDVLEASGALLVEVGTTNRTRLRDYTNVVSQGSVPVTAILKVHQSNYRMVGFTEETSLAELVTLGLPVIADIGSGLLDSTLPWLASRSGSVPTLPWLADEPGARQAIAEGAGLVIFSGDKLLGGPQAGIIVGSRALVDRCAAHPLARALRPGSLVIGALQDTLLAYARNDARSIPFWNMATIPVSELRNRAERIAEKVRRPELVRAVSMDSVPGGGTLPDRTIASFGVAVSGEHAEAFRGGRPPIVCRTEGGSTMLDLRTVGPSDDDVVIAAILSALTGNSAAAEG